MAQTIKIGVEFFDAQESAKALLDQLRKEAGRFKAGTAISDALVGDIKSLEGIIKKLDSSLAKGFNSHSDVNKVVNDFNQITRIYEHVASTIEKTKFQDLNLNFDDFSHLAKDLSQATAELAKFKSQKEKIEQTTVQDLLGKTNKNLSLFSTDQLSTSSTTIWSKLTQDLEKYKNSLSDVQQKTQALQNSYNAAEKAAKTGNQVYKRDNDILSLIGESPKNQADMKTIRGSFIQDIQASLKLDDNKMNLSKAFSVTQKKTLEEWLAPLGLSADSVQNIIATGKSRAEALSEELTKLPYKDIPKVRKAVKASLAQRTLDNEAAKAKREYESSEKKRIAKEQTVSETEARIKALEAPLQQKDYLSTGSNITLDQKIGNLLSRVQALETQLRQKASSGLNAGVNGGGNIPSVSGEPYHNALNQQAETADLERQGRAMIQRWIGTEAIVNKVRNGIRQAYQDIKSLDAAMTNIAVVTDMSIGDLWGKIDSYMSIAKQYGVTTQGVYEVSQLYYQQGLSTSEVMAATSETLKMARIAGMDYAEAADAMTVAIRAFKMEMSDAQTVTDVYSKVAAITASDSEELAIAMSKTASSAASVGSSFENTTAMLAVMVETTRESAQNLGSALKSIISRYGEMKTGVTVDADGEAIDYNKVDTALQSIGIALKDTQGQFRDFDDVIFELSEKWDTLDKNTQRYIATIMAGNRQQSRFIALVDNWERLDEVAIAAQDSEDAGLLQYAKTLDSLETKLNNIKTSFQEFYMSIINGPVIGKVFEAINSLFEGFNKQGPFAALLDVGSIVSSLTIIGNMFVSIFSGAFGQISANWKAMLQGLPADAAVAGQAAGTQYTSGATKPKGIGKLGTSLATAASFAGLALTTVGAATTQKYHNNVGAGMSAVGNALSYGSMGFMLSGGNPIATAVAAILGGITSGVAAWRSDFELEQAKLQDLQKQAEEKNIERAEAKNEYSNLKALLDSYQKADKNKNISEETYQQWLDINNQITEAYPALLDYIDAEGNAIADVTSATEMLDAAFQKMTTTTWDYYQAKKAEVQQEIVTNQSKTYSRGSNWDYKDAFSSGYSKEDYNKARVDLYQKYFSPYNDVDLFKAMAVYKNNAGKAIAKTPGEFQQLLANSPEMALLNKAGLIDVQQKSGSFQYALLDQGKNFNINMLNQRLADKALTQKTSKEIVDAFGADYIQQALIDYNNSVYDKNISLDEDIKGAITLFADLGVFQGDAGEIFSLDETVKNYINQAKLLQELDSLASEAHLSLITGLLGENNKNVKDIDGYAKLVLSYVELVGGFTGDEINSTNLRNTDEQGKTIVDKANDAFNEVQQSLASQPALLDIFNSFYGNLGDLSFEEVNFQLESFGIQDNEEEKDLYDIYTQRWYALQYRNFARWITSLTDQKIIPYETWLESQQKEGEEAIKDSEAMRAQYAKEILGQLETSESDSWLSDLITNNTTTTIDSLTSLSNSLNKTIKESSEGSITRKTATQQKGLLDRVKDSTKIQEAFKNLPNPQKIEEEFYSLFLTDFGTSEWGEKLQAFAQKYDVDLATLLDFDTDIGKSLDDYIFENFDIQVKAASESIDTIRKTWDDLAEKQKKGFTQKEADNLVQQLNKASGNTDKAFEDYFNISNEGIITLSDFDDALTTLVSDDTNKLDKLLESANAELTKIKASGGANIIQTSKNAVENERNLIKLGLTDNELIQTLSNQMITEDIGTDFNVTEEVENYVNQLNNFNKILENYKASVVAETTKQSTINSFYGGEAERKKLSAQKSLASGGQGLSGDTIYDILDAYSLSHEDWQTYFTKNADGTFDIITSGKLFEQLDQTTKNAILDKIASDVDSAEQGLQKLGETAATGEKLDASEIRKLLGAQFDGLSDISAEFLYTWFKKYIDGTGTKDDLTNAIAIMLQKQASSKGQNLSIGEAKKQAEKYLSEIDAELVDATDKSTEKLLELKGKALRGELTETEATSDIWAQSSVSVDDFKKRTNDAIVDYIKTTLENISLTFEQKVKNIQQSVYEPAFDEKFGPDLTNFAKNATSREFSSRSGATEFLAQLQAITGAADGFYKVEEWFTLRADGIYELSKSIAEIEAELNKSDLTQEQKQQATELLHYQKNLQKLQRKESLTSSLKSLATSSDNITASQIMSLIQGQGKTVSISEAETYAKDLQDLNPIERLKELVKILKQEHISVDTDTYQNLVKETITSIMNSASTSISKLGSGMSWNDAFNLTKEIEGLNFSDFEVIGDQYFVNNTEKAVKYYQEQVSAAFNEQAKMIEGAADVPIELLQSGNLGDWTDLPIADLSGQYEKAQALMQSEYFDETHYKQWLSQAGNKSKDFGQYWQEYINSLDEAAQAAILAWKKEADKQLAIANRAAELKQAAGEGFFDKAEAKEIIKSRGLSGYSPEDVAKLEAAGYLTAGQATLQDDGTYTIPKDILTAVNDISVGNAINIKLTSEVESAKTAADNLAKNILSGTATLENYTALFGDKYTSDVGEALERYLTGSAQVGDEEKLKGALKIKDRTDADVTALLSQLGVSYADYKHELARSIFDTKIEALSSGYLSEASKETLKKGGASDFVTKFAGLAGKAADKIFDAVYEEYEKAYANGIIKRDEYRTGIAGAASKAFTAKVEAKKPSLYLDNATKEIAGGDALYDADALGSLYAAIADKQKAAKEEVLTFDEFYNQYVNGITEAGEAILDVKALKGANLISDRRYKEFSSTLVDNLFSSAEEIITQFKTGDTIGLDLQIQQMFDSLGMALSSKDAEAIVKGGEQVLLNRLIFEIGRAGLDTTEVQSRLEELQALILDTIIESISSGMSALGEGIKGTLSEASFLDLQNRYGFKDSSFRTSRGVQLSAQNRQDIISGLYGEAKANGRTAGFGEQLLEILNTEGSGFEGYKDIEEAIADANKQIAEGVKGAKEYAEALKLARDAAYDMADAAEFAFMEQDGYDGKADTFDKFTENVTKAKEALATFKKGGKVAHADLTAMFDVIKSSDSGMKAFNNALAGTNLNIDDMLNTALRLNKLGEIDIGKVTAEWGIDIETATSAMAEGMSASLQETAKGQIEYLSGLEAMLEAMVALEGIGGIKLDLEFDTGLTDGNGDPIIVKQLSEVYDWWDKLDSDKQKELQYDIDLTLKNASTQKPLQSFMKGFGFGDADFFTTFFGKGVDSDMEVQLADAFGTLLEQLPNLTAGQAQTVVEEMNRALQGAMLTDKEGNFAGWKDNYIDSLLQFFSTFNLSDIPESLSAEISKTLATNNNKITIPIKDGINIVIQSSKDGKGFNVVDAQGKVLTGLSDEQISAIKDTLAKDYAMAVENIRVDADTGLVSFYGEAAKTETEALKTEFTSVSEAATGVSDAINKLQTLLGSFQVSDAFREFVNLMTQLVTGSTGVTKTVEGAQNAANMEQLNAEVDGENERIITLKIDIKEAEESFAEIRTAFDELVALLSTPITINVNSVGAISGAAISQTDGNTPPNTNPNGGVNSPLSSHTVQVVWDVQQPDFSQIQEPTIGFDWKQPTKVPGPRTLPTVNFYWGSALNVPKYTGSAIKIPIEYVEPVTEGAGVVAWTGTMNDISGAAFADGSIGRLYSGAQLAGKTLVGELGPELAVYDGQYHLLGQHGAEFVNLPSDAIIFNHRQTEGIARGQFNIRGKAMADGNITGPAMAGGAAAALEAVRRAKSLWQGLLDDLTAAQLAGGSQGGGGGNTLKGVKEELQEWYNLSRQIADIEQEINNLIAERQNIAEKNGDAYLRSLRKEQELLEQQAATQEILLGYQQLQLERQAEQINTNKIWSQFLEVDESGLLQYIKGNELNGGKGALEVLSELNEMSGEEQLKFLNNLGYTAVNQDGERLEGQELIQKFFEELQLQIDEYDALYDTVHETEETLENLQHKVEEINDQIVENQMDLEQDIFDILVDAWEEEIEALEEQKDLIEEANDAYVKGLNEALSAEREMYSEEQSIADREQLQRQLSLLRRSGGSASQIADLEQQLDSMLKDEYFRNQEQVIERIEDANEEQIRQLERQIRLQEEALEFEKEHGILWTKVYDIMAGSADQILNFMQGNSPEFFSQSLLQQEEMLTDWAHKIGIYTENRSYEDYKSYAQSTIWDTGDIWTYSGLSSYRDLFNSLTTEQQAAARERFNTTYANSSLAGEDHNTAIAKAKASLLNYLSGYKGQQDASQNKPETDEVKPSTGSGSSSDNSSSAKQYRVRYTVYFVDGQSQSGSGIGSTPEIARSVAESYAKKKTTSPKTNIHPGGAPVRNIVYQKAEAFSKGGYVNYTGLALVHGSPSKPEAFLNAKQTAMISEAVKVAGDGGALDGIKTTLNKLDATIKSIVNNNKNETTSFTVAPGAVTIQVAQLNDSYDVEELSKDVMNRMVAIASKSTNRGVNRR